ncbi:MAG TPA: 50S ribosomal protein L13, partial [Gemmatimonadaceae bacterium]
RRGPTLTYVPLHMKTYSAAARDIQHQWYIVDADGVVLGRLATAVANIIRGKHKPMFTPHMDTGDNVIVINAAKVRVTGRKAEQKRYFRHTGYMGHERFMPFEAMLAKHPERVIEKAVYGMLPKTALGRQKLRGKLRVFAGADHTHAAQQPKVLELNNKSEK